MIFFYNSVDREYGCHYSSRKRWVDFYLLDGDILAFHVYGDGKQSPFEVHDLFEAMRYAMSEVTP